VRTATASIALGALGYSQMGASDIINNEACLSYFEPNNDIVGGGVSLYYVDLIV